MLFRSAPQILFVAAVVLLGMGTLGPVSAASAVQCHCFTERSYKPADKFAADGYMLATTFNSMLAKSFGLPKRQIIMIKMNEGVEQDDLLVALHTAKLTGIDVRKFLGLRRNGSSWAGIIAGLAHQEAVERDAILQAVKSGMPAAEAGAMITDALLVQLFRATPLEIESLRAAGLDKKEMTLLLLLSRAANLKPEKILARYREQGKSWAEIAHSMGLEPDAPGRLILDYPATEPAR